MKPISTDKAPAAIGPYSQAIDSGAGLVFLSGQLPIDPATGVFPEGGIREQTRQSILNAQAILQEAGLSLSNVVKTTVFLADMGDFASMNEVYAQFFASPSPEWIVQPNLAEQELSVSDMLPLLQLKDRKNFLELYLSPAIHEGFVTMLYPNSPRHPRQKYLLTAKGQALFYELKKHEGKPLCSR